MMLFATLALSACGKDDEAPKAKPQPVSIELNALAEVNSEPQPSNSKQARAMDYKFVGNEIKYSLEGKTHVPVHTYIYDGDTQIFSEKLDWAVNREKTGVAYNGTIQLKAEPQTNNVKLIAVIADGTHRDHVINMTYNYSVGKLFTTSDQPQINVPYIMETALRREVRGGRTSTLDNFTQPNKKFKPQGYLLRCKLKNSLGEPVTVQGLVSYNTLPEKVSVTIPEKELVNEPEGGRSTHGYKYVPFEDNQKITLAAGGGVSSKFMLLWIPTLTTPTKYQLDLWLDSPSATAVSGFTTSLFTHEPSYYTAGKIYDVTLDLQTLVNPLSLMSKYPLNYDGTRFLTDLNDYAPGQPIGMKNAQVGYFNTDYANSNFVTPKRYGTSDLWHLPAQEELSSIFPNTIFNVKERINGQDVTFESQNDPLRENNYTLHSYRFLDDVQVGGYRRTVQTEFCILYSSGRGGYTVAHAVLFGAVPQEKLGSTNFPPELTNHRLYAAEFILDNVKKVWTIRMAKVPREGCDIRNFSNINFNEPGAIKRTIPLYGWIFENSPSVVQMLGEVGYSLGGGLLSAPHHPFNYKAQLSRLPATGGASSGTMYPVYLFKKP